MALGLLGLMASTSVILTLIVIALLFFKKGKFAENIFGFVSIQLYCVILSWLYITSLPTNYIGEIILGWVLLIISLGVIFIKTRSFKFARLILGLLSIILPIIIFFI